MGFNVKKDKIQENFAKNDIKICANSLKNSLSKSVNWVYEPMFYPHIGTVTVMCDQYSQIKRLFHTVGTGSYCYEIKRNENLGFII